TVGIRVNGRKAVSPATAGRASTHPLDVMASQTSDASAVGCGASDVGPVCSYLAGPTRQYWLNQSDPKLPLPSSSLISVRSSATLSSGTVFACCPGAVSSSERPCTPRCATVAGSTPSRSTWTVSWSSTYGRSAAITGNWLSGLGPAVMSTGPSNVDK